MRHIWWLYTYTVSFCYNIFTEGVACSEFFCFYASFMNFISYIFRHSRHILYFIIVYHCTVLTVLSQDSHTVLAGSNQPQIKLGQLDMFTCRCVMQIVELVRMLKEIRSRSSKSAPEKRWETMSLIEPVIHIAQSLTCIVCDVCYDHWFLDAHFLTACFLTAGFWNFLPAALRNDSIILPLFKRHLKTWFENGCSALWHIPDLYNIWWWWWWNVNLYSAST